MLAVPGYAYRTVSHTETYVNTNQYLDTWWYAAPVSTERLGRQARKQLTRQLLIDAAAAVFARQGFDATSLDAVAEAAGFTKGAVYSNFRGKTDLIMALIERRMSEQVEQAARALAGATLDEAIRRLEARPGTEVGKDGGAGARDDADTGRPVPVGRDWLRLMYEFWHYAMRDERARRALAEQYERARTITSRMIAEKYEEAGRTPPMPVRDLAILVEAVGIGLAFQAALDPAAVPPGLQGEAARRLLAPADAGTPAGPAAPGPAGPGTGESSTMETTPP